MHERDAHRSVVEVDFRAEILDEGICVEMSVADSDLQKFHQYEHPHQLFHDVDAVSSKA